MIALEVMTMPMPADVPPEWLKTFVDPQPIPPITEAQAQAAARTVACHALNAADARRILAALGLLERGRIVAPWVTADRVLLDMDGRVR